MPLYLYKCSLCDAKFDVFKPIAELDREELHCATAAQRCISLPMIAPDYPAYESPVTGKIVEGKRAHIEDLKRSGCRLLEPGETDHYEKNWKKDREAAVEKAVNEAIKEAAKDLGLG